MVWWTIGGSLWSWIQLNCAALLGDALSQIDLAAVNTVVELGGGLGRNIMMLAKLRPTATILAFDIMPQVYVANQYLKTAMPERVVPIEKAIELNFSDGDISSIKGKIVVLPAWKMPEYQNVGIDLFWNAASFQEMEPDVVRNYLTLVKRMKPRWISIMAMPGGNYWGEWKPGRGGTKEPVVSTIYFDGLTPEYEATSDTPADLLLRVFDYRAFVFSRREVVAGARRHAAEPTTMRIIVTGGSGFLGSHIADALSAAGHEAMIFDLARSRWLQLGPADGDRQTCSTATRSIARCAAATSSIIWQPWPISAKPSNGRAPP